MPILTDSSQTPEVSCSDKRPKIIYPKTLMRQKRSAPNDPTASASQKRSVPTTNQKIFPGFMMPLGSNAFFHTPHQV